MKLPVLTKTGEEKSQVEVDTPSTVRDDIYKKAVLAENTLFTQPKGAYPKAGKRQVINVSKKRKSMRSTYGSGGSRTPRKTMWSRGMQFRFVGAFSANTRGGRRAHPPKAEKNVIKKVNNKEWDMAIESGLAASLSRETVESNGQKIHKKYPFVLDTEVENTQKTKDVITLLKTLGFEEEMQRTSSTKVRAGKGKMRNRRTRSKRGPL